MTTRAVGERQRVPIRRRPSFVALVLVTGISPLATDTYVAALPQVQRSLRTSPGAAQLTMTAFIIGLAVGQLLCGPISDSVGRRRMLVGSSVAFAVLSALCAVAPDVALLIVARTLEGFAGGCGVAVGRAVVSDQHSGRAAAQRFGTLASVTLIAPVLAPAVGGVILIFGDWRTIFVFLAVIGLVMVTAVLLGMPETLPAEARHPSGLGANLTRMKSLLTERGFVTPVFIQCLATAGFFTYIGGSSFVLQDQMGLTRTGYTVLFASNAACMVVASVVFRLTVVRVGPARLRTIGLVGSASAAMALAGYAIVAGARIALAPTSVLLAVTVAGMGLCIPATTAIAQEVGRRVGGTASALQGGLTFGVGAAATPLTGLLGVESVTGMATIMATFFLCAVVSLVLLTRRRPRVAVNR